MAADETGLTRQLQSRGAASCAGVRGRLRQEAHRKGTVGTILGEAKKRRTTECCPSGRAKCLEPSSH